MKYHLHLKYFSFYLKIDLLKSKARMGQFQLVGNFSKSRSWSCFGIQIKFNYAILVAQKSNKYSNIA